MYKNLVIWVEGPDDKRFFDKIIKPRFERKYGRVHIRQYSNMNNQVVVDINDSLKKQDYDCICVTDINKAPCVSQKKNEKQKEEFKNVDKNSIIVVIKEIESWYLAGLDDNACNKFGFTTFSSTDGIGKGQFKELQRNLRQIRFDSGIDLMQEILKSFKIETAKQKNKSFRYLIEKYELQV